jgi:phospholipid/cholesterol/gamma-HCH transport system substrate-binding protein
MVTTKTTEVAVGVFVALGLAAFFMLAMQVSGISGLGEEQGYVVMARFDNIGGLRVRSPVTMAGVRIGRVTGINMDEQSYEAVVEMAITPKYDRLPQDTSASILTSGLLGEQYIGLEPGGADTYLKPGDQIKLTQSALVLERVISQFLFSTAEGRTEQAPGLKPAPGLEPPPGL